MRRRVRTPQEQGGADDAAAGRLVADRYRVERRIGSGTRKVVHLAHDVRLQRPVALCTLRPEHRTAEGRAGFQAEAALLSRLAGHPNVITVLDLCEHDGDPVLVLQHASGGTLEARLHASLAVAEALGLALDVARALDHAHRHGVVHRDVAPENVWLDASGRALLGDFGLAVLAGTPAPPLVGSLASMSPGQAAGEPPVPADDVHGLGALLYRLLTGRPPVEGADAVDALRRLLASEPAPPSSLRPDVPPEVDELVLRLLGVSPRTRPTAAEAVAALATLLLELERPQPPATVRRPAEAGALVGREEELAEVRRRLVAAEGGRGALVLLLGEAGIGKTRTALAVAAEAGARGWAVLPGRCVAGDGAPALWPWTQVLRAAVREFGEEQVAAHAGEATRALSGRADGEQRPVPVDVAHRRAVLFDSVATLLSGLSTLRPVLVLVDDVHWADPASVELLELLAPALSSARAVLLVCGRLREDGDPEVLAALGRLATRADSTVRLTGLGRGDTAALLEATLGLRPDPAVVDDLHRRTGGNPFYLGEMGRLLAEEQRLAEDGRLLPGPVAVPAALRDVLLRRVSHVSPPCADLLRRASVLGREPRLDVLAAVAGGTAAELMALLDEAVAAQLVVPRSGVPVRYRFAHALVQEALYDDLPLARRAQVHRTAGRALAALCTTSGDVSAAEVAHHCVRAAADGEVADAVRWSLAAARAAAERSGYEDAVAHHERAVALAGSARAAGRQLPAGLPGSGALLLALGEARWLAGDADGARDAFQRAVNEALAHDDAELLAHAALGLGHGLGGFGFVEHADGELLSLLEEALAALPEQDSSLRVRLLGRLATELYFTPFRSRRVAVSQQALEMAGRLGDPADEVVALYSRVHALLGPDDVEERRRAADRVVRLATSLGDVDVAFRGHCLRLAACLEAGAVEQAAADAAACRRIAERHGRPEHRWQAAVFDAEPQLRAGEYANGRRLADAALELGRRGSGDMAAVMWGAQLLLWAWGTGRIDEVASAVGDFADRYPHAPAWRAASAFCQLELGRLDQAQAELEACCGPDLGGLPRDGNWLTAAALLAHVAAGVGDDVRARALAHALEPYSDRTVVIAAGAVVLTSVHLPLGVLHGALGDVDRALGHLAAAAAEHRRLGAEPFVVWTACEQVRLLVERGAPEDHAAAAEVLLDALPLARRLDMAAHVRRLLDGSSRLVAGTRLPAEAAVPEGAGTPVTILLTDVADSTGLTENLGERTAHALLEEHRRVVATHAAAHGGVVVKSLGDGLLVTFAHGREALDCALDVAQAHTQLGGGAPLRLRMSVHSGPVLRQRGSMYGLTMIVGARLTDLAQPGDILVSEQVLESAPAAGLRFSPPTEVTLRGLSTPQRVFRLLGRAPRG